MLSAAKENGDISNFLKSTQTYSEGACAALKQYAETTKLADMTTEGLIQTSVNLKEKAEGIKNSFGANGLVGTFKNFISTVTSMGANMLVGVVTSGIINSAIESFYNYKHAAEIAIEKGEEAKKTISEINSEYSQHASSVSSIGNRFDTLQAGVNPQTNENISLTNDQYSEYLSLCNEIAGIYPELVISYDTQGNAILNLGTSAQTAEKQLQELLKTDKEIANLKITDNLQSQYEGTAVSVKQTQDKINRLNQENEERQNIIDSLVKIPEASKQIENMRSRSKKFLELDSRAFADVIPTIKEIFNNAGIEYQIDNIDTDGDASADEFLISLLGLPDDESLSKALDEIETKFETESYDLKEKLSQQSNENKLEISSLEKEKAAEWNSLIPSIIAALETNPNYSELDEKIQNGIVNQVSSIDFSKLQIPENKSLEDYIKETYLYPITGVFNDNKVDKAGVNIAAQAQEVLKKFFSTDFSKYTVEEYEKQIDDTLKPLHDYYIKALGEEAGDVKFNNFLQDFGIVDESGLNTMIRNHVNTIRMRFLSEGKETIAAINEMTVGEIQAMYDLITNPAWGGTYEDAVKELSGEVQKAVDDTPSISFSSLFTGDDGNQSDFSKIVDKFQSDMDSLKSALDSLSTKNLDSSGLTDLIQEFPQLAGQTDNLEAAIENLKVDKLKSFMDEVKKVSDNVTDPTEQAKLDNYVQNIVDSVDLSKVDAKNFRSTLTDVLFKDSDLEGSAKTGPLTQFSKIINNLLSDLDDSVETEWTKEIVLKLAIKNEDASTWDYSEWMKQIQDEMTRQQKNLTFESLIGDNGKLSSAISIYTTEMEKLTSAKQKLSQTGSVISESEMGSLLSDVPELKNYVDDLDGGLESLINTANTNVIDTFTQEIERLKLAGKDADASALQAYLENLKSTASGIESAYGKIGGMTVNTPLLNDYDKALETKNEGAIYDKIKEVAKATKELYDAGDYGVDEFKAGAKVFSMSGSTTVADFEENYPKIERYLLQDSDTQGVQNFFEDLQTKGYASLETAADGTQYWTTQIDDLNKAATDMGMTYEWFMGMLGEADDKGFISDFVGSTQEGIDHLSDLYGELGTKQAELSKLESSGETDNTTLSNIERLESEIEELQGRIETTREGLEKLFTVDTQDAATKVQAGKDAISAMQEELLKLDPNDENYDSIRAVIMDQIQAIAQKYHIELEPEVQTDEVSSQTQEAVEKAQSVADRNPVTVKVQTTGHVQAPTSTVTQGVSTAAQTVSVNADNSSAIGKVSEVANTAKNKKATVPIDGNPSGFLSKVAGAKTQVEANKAIISVDANTNPLKNSIANALAGEHHISVTASVHGVNIPGAATQAAGTLHAHASGTAYNMLNLRAHASGTDVGLKQDENALVNELGE